MGNWITNYQLCGMKLNCKLLSASCIDLTLFNTDFHFPIMPASLTEKKNLYHFIRQAYLNITLHFFKDGKYYNMP